MSPAQMAGDPNLPSQDAGPAAPVRGGMVGGMGRGRPLEETPRPSWTTQGLLRVACWFFATFRATAIQFIESSEEDETVACPALALPDLKLPKKVGWRYWPHCVRARRGGRFRS